MGKDSDVNVKKRRKLSTVSPVKENSQDTDVYKRVVEFEEHEASQRSSEKDGVIFQKTCDEIRAHLAEIAELKTEIDGSHKEKIKEKRIQVSLLLVALKKLNRLEKVRAKAGRDALHKEKQRLDSTHLLLQNLLYEADHLDKEVTKRIQFKSKDEDIELVSIDEFYKDAPPDVSRSGVTKKDEHQQRLARLEWELQQRRQLSKTCSELAVSKERVSTAIAESRSRLGALKPLLKDILKSTKPVQEMFNMKLDEMREQNRISSMLPPALFLLYANASAYADAFGENILTVDITGDEEEARRIEISGIPDLLQENSNDSESDQEANGEETSKKKRHRKRISKQEQLEEKKKEALKQHPLNVRLFVKNKDGTMLSLVFLYMIQLKLVTVKASISTSTPIVGVSAADVLNGFNILHELYPEDDGSQSPHPATQYILKTVGVDGEFSQFIPDFGRPYLWAQRMCGLNFASPSISQLSFSRSTNLISINPCTNLSRLSVESILLTLQKRLKDRIGLMKELQDLESGKLMPFQDSSIYPVRLLGSLTQWQTISWSEYVQSSATTNLIRNELVSQHDLLYRAIITRQSAKLVALVVIKSDYPKKAPLFALTLHWNGTHHSGTDDDIRDIERCINTDWCGGNISRCTLTGQLTKLLACLDILLEAIGSSEFPPDKIMFRPVRGRNRAKPYKFLKQGSGVFTQY